MKYDKELFNLVFENDEWLEHKQTGYVVRIKDQELLKVFFLWVEDKLKGKPKGYKESFKTIEPLMWDFFYDGVLAKEFDFKCPDGFNRKVDRRYYGSRHELYRELYNLRG